MFSVVRYGISGYTTQTNRRILISGGKSGSSGLSSGITLSDCYWIMDEGS